MLAQFLPLVAQDIGLSGSADTTRFIGHLAVMGASVTFGYYAFRNDQLNRIDAQNVFWRLLILASVTGFAFGIAGGIDVFFGNRWTLAIRSGLLLFFIVFIAFSLREVYFSTVATTIPKLIRRLEVGYMITIIIISAAVIMVGQTTIVQIIQGAGGVAFAVYGTWFGAKVEKAVPGTPIETLARHLVPLLLVTGFLSLGDLAASIGINPILAGSVTNVFIVIVAAFLASSTIRLQQNVAEYA